MIGKIGRLFAIGPREFGVHPSVRYIRMVNNSLLHIFATSHSDGFFK